MYKRLFTFFILFGIVFHCFADIISFTSGVSQEVEIKEITPTEIKYTKIARPKGPLYTVLKSDVASIIYDDGTTDSFNTNIDYNKPNIPDTNTHSDILRKYEADVHYKGNETKKEAKACYALCRFNDNSILCDGNVMVEYLCGVYSPIVKNASSMILSFEDGPFWLTNTSFVFWPAIRIKLSNLSSKTIYIDLANTFFKRGSLVSPYYIPSSTTNLQSETNGIGLNLGGITNAMGIGGAVGNLASGINLGTSSTSGTATTIYSQRIISIPPQSFLELTPQLLFPPNLSTEAYRIPIKHYSFNFSTWQLVGLDKTNLHINIGQTNNYDNVTSPISFGVFLSYSHSEQFYNIKTLDSTAYMCRLIGLEDYKPAWHGRFHTKKTDNLSDDLLKPLHFFCFVH